MPKLISELIRHTFVLVALGVVGVILVGSIAYYVIESTPPAVSPTASETASTTDVTGTGTVTPIENPDLSFAARSRPCC